MDMSISDRIRSLKVGEKVAFKGKNLATIRSAASRIRAESDLRLVFATRPVKDVPTVWRLV